MTNHLRTISVSVDEPDPGQFFLVLMESSARTEFFEDLKAADAPEATWDAALDAGVAALKKLAKDRTVGPRAASEDEDADPVG